MTTSEEMNRRASESETNEEGIFLMLKAIYWKLNEMNQTEK